MLIKYNNRLASKSSKFYTRCSKDFEANNALCESAYDYIIAKDSTDHTNHIILY